MEKRGGERAEINDVRDKLPPVPHREQNKINVLSSFCSRTHARKRNPRSGGIYEGEI